MSTSGIIVPNQLCDNFYVVGVDEFLIPENETQFSSTTNSTNLNNNDNNLNENNTPQNQPELDLFSVEFKSRILDQYPTNDEKLAGEKHDPSFDLTIPLVSHFKA